MERIGEILAIATYWGLTALIVIILIKYGYKTFKTDTTISKKEKSFYLVAVVLLFISIFISALGSITWTN